MSRKKDAMKFVDEEVKDEEKREFIKNYISSITKQLREREQAEKRQTEKLEEKGRLKNKSLNDRIMNGKRRL